MGFQMDTRAQKRGITQMQARATRRAETCAGECARELETEARARAPWTDRTGRARNGIRGRAEVTQDAVKIVLSGTAPHSVYLERGKWAVLGPTVQEEGGRMLGRVARAMLDE